MVAVTVGAAAADGICIDTPTPLSAKSNNKTGIQKGMFLIFHYLLSFMQQLQATNRDEWSRMHNES